MKTITVAGSLASILAFLMLPGCASSPSKAQYSSVPSKSVIKSAGPESPAVTKPPTESLQGNWKGKELGGDNDGPVSLKVEGNRFEFHGADPNEWYKGTFTLREDTDPKQFVALIAECANQDFIGKTSKVIYRLRDGKLILAARAPGSEEAPADLNDSESRHFEFSR
jgi:uncharacterized protein (TIGR03067 family)